MARATLKTAEVDSPMIWAPMTGMGAHDLEFLVRQLARLHEHGIGDAHLAEVVQRAARMMSVASSADPPGRPDEPGRAQAHAVGVLVRLVTTDGAHQVQAFQRLDVGVLELRRAQAHEVVEFAALVLQAEMQPARLLCR